jgi:hypothetical protein
MGVRFSFKELSSSWIIFILFSLEMAGVAADSNDWEYLFNGRDLAGWVQKGGSADFRVENGELVGRPMENTANAFLCTTSLFTNFVLECEFKMTPGMNSGVQFHSQVFNVPTQLVWSNRTYKIPAQRVHGCQIEIDSSKRAWTGSLYDEGRRGWLVTTVSNDVARHAFKTDGWNKLRLEVQGPKISSMLNGVPAIDYVDSLQHPGFIAIQVHTVPRLTNALEVRFKSISIKTIR